MVKNIARTKAKKELENYPECVFINNQQVYEANIHKLGYLPKDLERINDITAEFEVNSETLFIKKSKDNLSEELS
jgi:hypothetical protein